MVTPVLLLVRTKQSIKKFVDIGRAKNEEEDDDDDEDEDTKHKDKLKVTEKDNVSLPTSSFKVFT